MAAINKIKEKAMVRPSAEQLKTRIQAGLDETK